MPVYASAEARTSFAPAGGSRRRGPRPRSVVPTTTTGVRFRDRSRGCGRKYSGACRTASPRMMSLGTASRKPHLRSAVVWGAERRSCAGCAGSAWGYQRPQSRSRGWAVGSDPNFQSTGEPPGGWVETVESDSANSTFPRRGVARPAENCYQRYPPKGAGPSGKLPEGMRVEAWLRPGANQNSFGSPGKQLIPQADLV